MSWCDTCTNEDGAECISCRGWQRDSRPVGQYIQYRNSSGGFTTAGPFNDEEARAFRARIAGVAVDRHQTKCTQTPMDSSKG